MKGCNSGWMTGITPYKPIVRGCIDDSAYDEQKHRSADSTKPIPNPCIFTYIDKCNPFTYFVNHINDG